MSKLHKILHEAEVLLINSDTPRLDAELLLAHAVGTSRMNLLIDYTQQISEAAKTTFLELIKKRSAGIPVSKIIGQKEFWSLDFVVNHNVLDPRPDSEIIIETLLRLKINKNRYYEIGDFGTGSGCLAITTALELPKSKIFAFEKSPAACQVARRNIENHKLIGRIKLLNISWAKCSQDFDIIISNPPYIGASSFNKLSDDVKLSDPRKALYGGFNGLEFYRELFALFRRYLRPHGIAIVEIGELHKSILHNARMEGFIKSYFVNDFSGHKRVIVLKRKYSLFG